MARPKATPYQSRVQEPSHQRLSPSDFPWPPPTRQSRLAAYAAKPTLPHATARVGWPALASACQDNTIAAASRTVAVTIQRGATADPGRAWAVMSVTRPSR